MKQLHPKVVWLFFTQYGVSAFFLGIVVGPFLSMLPVMITQSQSPTFSEVLPIAIPVTIVATILFVILAYFWSRLIYKYYRYELREEGFRKESGVIWKHYVTIPYDRIQNVDIHRGILDRFFGLSDLQIQTAGISGYGQGGGGAEGRLPGILPSDAEQLRDEFIQRSKGSKQNINSPF